MNPLQYTLPLTVALDLKFTVAIHPAVYFGIFADDTLVSLVPRLFDGNMTMSPIILLFFSIRMTGFLFSGSIMATSEGNFQRDPLSNHDGIFGKQLQGTCKV